MTLLKRFSNYCEQTLGLISTHHQFVLAVSGGVDSVVLVDLFDKAGFSFVIAHCNFQLRGEESIRDENFVTSLGLKYNKQVLVKVFNTKQFASHHQLSIQLAARQLRYHWFNQLVIEKNELKEIHPPIIFNKCFLATAHHADDNIETLLLNFFRGTGISGLHGILPKQGYLLRPLLFAKKEELISYANQEGLLWVEDSSNELDKYSRNFLRHQIIPLSLIHI